MFEMWEIINFDISGHFVINGCVYSKTSIREHLHTRNTFQQSQKCSLRGFTVCKQILYTKKCKTKLNYYESALISEFVRIKQ